MPSQIEPYCQGDLDGLCGLYAIINALCALCPEIDEELATTLFRHLARHMEGRLKEPMPVIAYGIGATSLRLLLKRALRFTSKNLGVEIETTEFAMARRNLDLRKLWRHLSNELGSGQVTILMLRGASYHWTVACSATETTLPDRFSRPQGARALALHNRRHAQSLPALPERNDLSAQGVGLVTGFSLPARRGTD